MAATFETVDDYIAGSADDVRERLDEVRRAIVAMVPGAGEVISYGMPTITLDGRRLVHFAGWKHYISIYPAPDGDADFERDIARYRAAQSTLRFPHAEPLPVELVERVVMLLVEQSSGSEH